MEFGSFASDGTINIAPTGQWRAQFPHSCPSVSGMQFLRTHTAWPICIADFSATVIGFIALAGHTWVHLLHSGRQYPRSYDISGCISLIKSVEGRKTPLGHTDTHSWQAVQCCAKWLRLNAPGGSIWVLRFGIFLSSIMARPPSTVFSCAFNVAVAVAANAVTINVRRVASVSCCALWLLAVCLETLRAGPKLIAPNSQLPRQSIQSTQRL